MADADTVWRKFFDHRTKPLWERFPGSYRALVVETNDPLVMGRVRFKCPDMHDFSMSASECPWAVPAFELGGPRSGRFVHPCIGDWVWISFERQQPYGPIWTGFANPTRRKFYPYPSVHQVTPLSVNEEGKPADKPDDYDADYLPKDGRPMAHGWADRYGNLDISSSVGFFPEEHKDPPPPPDHDAIQRSNFDQRQSPPEVNSPDKKYMVRATKYGSIFIMSDQGYHWKKEGGKGEFIGSFKKDEQFEIKRWKSLQKFLNEGEPKGDHRRIGLVSRYGSKFEMRDTGWAQEGPVSSKSRPDEFGPPQTLSSENKADLRWIKLRTKGGMLLQAYDKGFHPNDDKFVKRRINDEMGVRSEQEDKYWGNKDARWIRVVTRYGIKIVLDDRGSDDKNADKREAPHGNGVLIKGRRSPSVKAEPKTGNPRGFYFEFNENDKANHSSWGSPMGQSIEMNDRYQYMMMAVSLGRKWASKFKGLKENEFIRKPMMLKDPEKSAYHLKLDHDNEYLRLKTRGGRGPRAMSPSNPSGVRKKELQQGLEARDGNKGDGPWVELVDSQHRGFWWSKFEQLGVWRAKKGRKMYQWFDDRQRQIVIYNNESNGTIEIYANSKVNIIAKRDVHLNADRNITMHAGRSIRMEAGGTRLTINSSGVHTNKNYYGRRIFAQICQLRIRLSGRGCKCRATIVGQGCQRPGGVRVAPQDSPTLPNQLEPTDRGQTYNEPFEECPVDEVEHPTGA